MSDVTSLVKKAEFNTKVTETEGKIPDVSSLVTKSALTVVENKIPDVSNLFKKTDFNTKVIEIEGKIPNITGLATNSELSAVENKIPDVSSLVEKSILNAELKKISDRITSNKSRHLQVENELKNYKNLMLHILEVKIILMEMVEHKYKTMLFYCLKCKKNT